MDTAPRTGEQALTFRDAGEADAADVAELVDSAYRGDASRAGWTTEADLLGGQRTDRDAVLEVINSPGSRLVVVERNGELIACFQLEHRDSRAYFGMFAVRPTLQGGGLGRTIIAEAERTARESWDVRTVEMTVISAREDLIAWYERRGYRRTGTTSPFPYGDERFGVPQRADLEFELLVKDLTA
ncbi:Acetyltransferase (GNAT) family protein [Streptomyces sp. YIM 130001]|uniref:GNAT family N-acetyltransferase n=1 Tax=Streptomyces sp. YIM 130001 TaxID=2259644 RepID=UPI000E6537E0|nr:GNAT family N-acetyltransferase [Streptomyces sp. YIM 130001]RII09310.1 Acetyltransferase (GNAT) family protein [Streptomyces sp. YIM 130001]